MKIVFFGTPEWAVPSLRALVAAGHAVAAVVTAPDAPTGRSREPQAPPVKRAAAELGLAPVLQPATLRGALNRGPILEPAAEAHVVVAYGRILPGRLLETPPHGAINLHFSLLPRHRGASPVQHTLLAGDDRAGVTSMRMDRGLDTGPILLQESVAIAPRERAASLGARLAEVGAALLVETLARLAEGRLAPRPQDDTQATLAPPLAPADGHVDWARPALAIERAVRAFDPWPPVVAQGPKGRVRLIDVEALAAASDAPPGTIVAAEGEWADIACGERTTLRVHSVQPAGSKTMSAGAALRGRHLDRARPLDRVEADLERH